MRKISSVKLLQDQPLSTTPPDGYYAVISYDGSPQMTRYHFAVDRVFKWWITIYKFEGGLCDEIGSGSSPAGVLNKYEDVTLVYLVKVPESKQGELDLNLAKQEIELVAESSRETESDKAEMDYIDGKITAEQRDDIVSGVASR